MSEIIINKNKVKQVSDKILKRNIDNNNGFNMHKNTHTCSKIEQSVSFVSEYQDQIKIVL